MPRFPILVQFESHPASQEAEELSGRLSRAVSDDSAFPGLRIETRRTPKEGMCGPPSPCVSDEADRVLVVLLADDVLAASSGGDSPNGWGRYVAELRRLCDESPAHWFMPVGLSKDAWPIDPRLGDLSFLQAWKESDPEKRARLVARRMVNLLIRQLKGRDTGELGLPVKIFLNHAKTDLENQSRAATALIKHISAAEPESAWVDSGQIPSGSRFAEEIEKGVEASSLLVVASDAHSCSSWCRREILAAKRHRRPFVIVDDLEDREIRRFPYAGNGPVIRWSGDPQAVVDALLRESLRHAYAEAFLSARAEPDDAILPSAPELLTVLPGRGKGPILYPEPPLGAEELDVLSNAGMTVRTPLERNAVSRGLGKRLPLVALSMSESDNVEEFGLRQSHLDGAMLEVSRYLLVAGVRLAYGGRLGDDGYTDRLAELLRDPDLERFRGPHGGTEAGGSDSVSRYAPPSAIGNLARTESRTELVAFLPWPAVAMPSDVARLNRGTGLVEVRRGERPPGLDETVDPAFSAVPSDAVALDTPIGRFARARGLTDMREWQTAETTARIVLGGRLWKDSGKYEGMMPGVLEEAWISIRMGRPVYLVGAYGGCARLVVDALEGGSSAERARDVLRAIPRSGELRDLYRKMDAEWAEFDRMVDDLARCGFKGLGNGLSVEENRELSRTRSYERIVELTLDGLERCS